MLQHRVPSPFGSLQLEARFCHPVRSSARQTTRAVQEFADPNIIGFECVPITLRHFHVIRTAICARFGVLRICNPHHCRAGSGPVKQSQVRHVCASWPFLKQLEKQPPLATVCFYPSYRHRCPRIVKFQMRPSFVRDCNSTAQPIAEYVEKISHMHHSSNNRGRSFSRSSRNRSANSREDSNLANKSTSSTKCFHSSHCLSHPHHLSSIGICFSHDPDHDRLLST